jgi:FkbM family methyltransferase
MNNSIINILIFFFGRKILYNFNLNIIKLFFTFIGNNIFFSSRSNGELSFLLKICKEKPELCIDVGANVGNFSKIILDNSRSQLILFEPFLNNFKKINKLKKKYTNRIFAFNVGLGNQNKIANLYYDKKNSLWANFNPEVNKIDYLKNNKSVIQCKIKKLDAIFFKSKELFKKKIKLLKIDTEGYEYEVLLGARKFIEKKKPEYIQIEYNWHHLFKNINLYLISKFLKNYDVYKILPYSSGLLKIDPKRPENNYYNYSNYVFKLKKLKKNDF